MRDACSAIGRGSFDKLASSWIRDVMMEGFSGLQVQAFPISKEHCEFSARTVKGNIVISSHRGRLQTAPI